MANLKFKVGGVWNQIVTIKGDKGDAGDALPAGGVAGQLLIKNSATDNDATWQNNPTHDDRYFTEAETTALLATKTTKPVLVTIDTPFSTTTKTGTTSEGDYVPADGDELELLFSAGTASTTATLAVDGGTAYPIMIGNSTSISPMISTQSAIRVRAFFSSGAYRLYGSQLNTQYSTIPEAEIINQASNSARLLTGARLDYYKVNVLDPIFADKAGKSTTVTATLESANWVGSSAPFTYNLTVSGVTETSNQELLPTIDITSTQLEALQKANIQDAGQSTNTISLKAFKTKPLIDIPIRVILRGDK